MLLIPTLNVYISPGDFIFAKNDAHGDWLIVCQVDDVIPPSNLLVTWWFEDNLLGNVNGLENRNALVQTDFLNVLKCQLPELMKVTSSQSIIDVSSVADIAFVFHVFFRAYLGELCWHAASFLHTLRS